MSKTTTVNRITIRAPPFCPGHLPGGWLRSEGEVEILAQFFLNQFMKEVPAFAGKRLSQTSIDLLYGYDFPGNVRELKNIIERAVYRDTTNEVTPEDIGLLGDHRFQAIGGNFNDKVKSFERQLRDEPRTATARKRPGASAFATISSVTCSKSTGWTRHRRAQGR